MRDERVNPGDQQNKAVNRAVFGGHLDTVKLLLYDKRVTLDLSQVKGVDQAEMRKMMRSYRMSRRESCTVS